MGGSISSEETGSLLVVLGSLWVNEQAKLGRQLQ